MVWGLGSRVQGSGFRVYSSGFRVQGVRCEIFVWVERSKNEVFGADVLQQVLVSGVGDSGFGS